VIVAVLSLLLLLAVQSKKQTLSPLRSHLAPEETLWAKNCDGDAADIIAQIKDFLSRARLTPEKLKEVQSGLEWIQNNCPIKIVDPVPFNCLGNVQQRIDELEQFLMTSRLIEEVRGIKEAELRYLKDVCQGSCPEDPQKAINELESQLKDRTYTPEAYSELQNKLKFWKEKCLEQEMTCPEDPEKAIADLKNELAYTEYTPEGNAIIQAKLKFWEEVCLKKEQKCPKDPKKAIHDLEEEMKISRYTPEKYAELLAQLKFWKEVCLKKEQKCPKDPKKAIHDLKEEMKVTLYTPEKYSELLALINFWKSCYCQGKSNHK